MKINYEAPQIEVIEIELEGVLCQSGDIFSSDPMNVIDGGSAW